MSGNKTYDQVFKAERDRLRGIEEHREFLKDKSVGRVEGAMDAPRPTADFIDHEEHLGKPKTPDEIDKEASRYAHEVMQEQQEAKAKDAQRFDLENRAESNLEKLKNRAQENFNELSNNRNGNERDDDGRGR